MNKIYRSIELFAGAGGLALGLEQAGFKHIGLVEFDKHAVNTLKYNRPLWNVLFEDVEEVSKRDLEKEFNIKKYELDLLSGGAPCQSFSYAGKRLGLNDVRGTMFYHYATFINKLKPKMFLFENVKGLLSHDKGKTFSTIKDIFQQEGYTIQYEVLNSIDYSVAQKRERLIIVGTRNDLIGKIEFYFPKKHKKKLVLRDILVDVPPSECAKYSDKKAEIFKLVPAGGY
ncbi:UNVERIFIED_CONTAM: DNA (cytosine-5-)-methyltransferase [Campylobacter lari]